jgi:hypothetical protein
MTCMSAMLSMQLRILMYAPTSLSPTHPHTHTHTDTVVVRALLGTLPRGVSVSSGRTKAHMHSVLGCWQSSLLSSMRASHDTASLALEKLGKKRPRGRAGGREAGGGPRRGAAPPAADESRRRCARARRSMPRRVSLLEIPPDADIHTMGSGRWLLHPPGLRNRPRKNSTPEPTFKKQTSKGTAQNIPAAAREDAATRPRLKQPSSTARPTSHPGVDRSQGMAPPCERRTARHKTKCRPA